MTRVRIDVPEPSGTAEIAVDGRAVAFELWRGEGVVRRGAEFGERAMAFEARGVDPERLAFERIRTVEPYFRDWRETVLAAYDEANPDAASADPASPDA